MNERIKHKEPKADIASIDQLLTISELAFCTGTTTVMIEQMLEEDLIRPQQATPEPCFATDVYEQVCIILRLHHHLGVGLPSMGLVLDLLDRIEEAERRIRILEAQELH